MNEHETHTYETIGAPRRAVLVLSPATYKTSWGDQNLAGPHMRIDEPNGDGHYGCDLSIFLDTYEDGEEPGIYGKTATVQAVRLTEPTTVNTLEGPAQASAGDWLVTNPKGEQYPVSDETFRATYRLVG